MKKRRIYVLEGRIVSVKYENVKITSFIAMSDMISQYKMSIIVLVPEMVALVDIKIFVSSMEEV